MIGITYYFALHKWRRHAFLKDKMPDERQNSFHLSFAAELLSDLWLNLGQKMIRKGRGLINHVAFFHPQAWRPRYWSLCEQGSPEAIRVAWSITGIYE